MTSFGRRLGRWCIVALLMFGMVGPGVAQSGFSQFVQNLQAEAVAAGVRPQTYQRAMQEVTYQERIARLISGQPEFTTPVWDYIGGRVSSGRIERGRAAFARNRTLFEQVGSAYGVDPYILAAIWGIETDFGAVLGNSSLIQPIIPNMATLVFENRGRVALDKAELFGAMLLAQAQGRHPRELVGSWAGAIGHLQVNPTVILRHGRDGNGDGVVDPHRSLADALATSAQLIRSFGYKPGVDWGFEVVVPSGFDLSLATRTQLQPVRFFAERGVARVAGRQFADLDEPVFLYLPAGKDGPAFLMTKNYLVLKDYNFSDSYAMSVAHLTDRLKGGGPFVQNWPTSTQFPNRQQRVDIQNWLKQLGFYDGEVDGRIGPISQEAYQKFQARIGVPADGFITLRSHGLLKQAVGQ